MDEKPAGWRGYTGPFDKISEEMISVFEKRVGLSLTAKIGNVGFFYYTTNEICGVGGEIKGINFKIFLDPSLFTQSPGIYPRFHFHSVNRVQIPGRILKLFRGYPEYYVYTGSGQIDPVDFLDEVIFRENSPLFLGYKPDKKMLSFFGDIREVKTDFILYRQDKLIPGLEDFPKEIRFGKIFREFEKILRKIIMMLEMAPKTKIKKYCGIKGEV